MMSLAVLYNI